ncbi:MAG TPA: hypothetical protein GXZ64_00765 [Clostridiaceae bacterium]|nr:hypothetical protein [Clostridiaceae bacterium]
MFGTYVLNSSVSADELIKILLGLAGVTALVFLAIVLARVAGLLKSLSTTMKASEEPLAASLKQLPSITENVSKLVAEATETVPHMLHDAEKMTGSVSGVVSSVGDAASSMAGAVSGFVKPKKKVFGVKSDTFESAADAVAVVASILISLFGKKKKK